MMKNRHQLRRRFSLQPSFLKDDSDDTRRNRQTKFKQQKSDISEESESTGSTTDKTDASNIRHKIVVMGAAKVGKSSIISQFLYNTYSPKYKRTIEEMHHSDFNVAGVHLLLDILDTSGSYEFPAMRALSISSGDAFILVYDVNDNSTFEEVRALRDQIQEVKGSDAVPIVIVGNKIDFDNRECDSATTESVVTVDWENGFVETSARDAVNITQVFKELLVQAKVKYNLSPALRRRRRQSLPCHQAPVTANGGGTSSAHATPTHGAATATSTAVAVAAVIPSPLQLQHLQQLRDRHDKRNSCTIS